MADDDFDWGDDPFDGDLDFDDDFDKPKGNQGFIKSFATGFLSGITNQTIGDTDTRIATLKKLLPKTFTGTFSNLQALNTQKKAFLEDLKADGVTMVQDLQYVAKRAAKALSGDSPNKISETLIRFSENDFSDWERTSTSGESAPTMESVSDDDVKEVVNNADANSMLERDTAVRVGKETLSMMAEVGGRTVGAVAANANLVVQSNQLLSQLLQHQRQVKAKNDALQLNILARTYLTNAKFYKFVETSNHRIVSELKKISKYSEMSDYEKTSNSQALRKSMRESVFNTVKSGFGGIRELIKDKLGKDARESSMMDASMAVGGLRMALEMSEGMEFNIPSMLGNAAAGIFLSKLPHMIESGTGQKYLAKFKKEFPELSKWAMDAYLRLTDLGNVSTYVTGNAEGLVNTLSKHYGGGVVWDEHDSYEEYTNSLKPGEKPLTKFEWNVLNAVKKTANKGISTVLDNVWQGGTSTYYMKTRTLADGYQQAMWTRQSDRTLNEIIPQWMSQIHLSIEKFRTGRDDIKALTYDYSKGRFNQRNQQIARTLNNVFDRNQLSSQANTANAMVENIDTQNALSKEAKQYLALRLAKDADSKLGVNPYNYFNLETGEDGLTEKMAEEIRNVVKGAFGITDDHITEFENASDAERLVKLAYLPTEEGRKKAAQLQEQSNYLKNFGVDISNNLDIMRSSGNYNILREAGIIREDKYGRDEVNMDLFWKMFRDFIANPDRAVATVPNEEQYLNRGTVQFNGPERAPQGQPGSVKLEGMEDLTKSLEGIKDLNNLLSTRLPASAPAAFDIAPLTDGIGGIKSQMDILVTSAHDRNVLLSKILDRQAPEKDKETEEEIKKEKRSILDRLKSTSFRDMFNNSVDKLLDHEPLILGGLLGGLAGAAIYNPKAAALLGGGAAIAIGYGKLRHMALVRQAKDLEDLYEEGSTIPLLEAFKLRRGDYLDMATNLIIDSWEGITGSLKDITNNTIIGARRLAGKLFTAENKEVFLSGLNKVRDMLMKAWRAVDPFGRAMDLGRKAIDRFHQMDVYKEGEDTPTLYGKSFAGGAYYKRTAAGEFVEIKGWNEIDGPVYDREGNVLITQEDYDRGLKTSMGVSINKLGNMSRAIGRFGLDFLRKAKEKTIPAILDAKDKVVDTFKTDFTPVTNSVDRIYYLLLEHFGYKPSATPPDNEDSRDEEEAENQVTEEQKEKTKKAKKPKKKKAPKGEDNLPSEEEIARREEKEANPESLERFKMKNTIHGVLERAIDNKEEPRLNSLADKEAKAKEKKSSLVQDAIITIARSFGFGNSKDGEKEKSNGLFGLLLGGLGGLTKGIWGITKFLTGSLWNSVKLMGTFAKIGIKTLPYVAKGIGGLVTGIGALTKGIFNLLGRRGGPDVNPPTAGGKLKSGMKKLGAGMLVTGAASSLTDLGVIDEDSALNTVMDVAGTATTAYGVYQMAAGAAGAMGLEMGVGGILAGLGTAAAPLILNPITLSAAVIGAAGYAIYKTVTYGSGKQVLLRLVQYGVSDPDSDLAKKVLKIEEMLTDFVVIGNGRASISKNAPLEDVFKLIVQDQHDKREMGDVFTWFNGRFKPVFLTYMACLDAVGMKTLKEYDESTSIDAYRVAKQAHQALSGVMPYPYSITANIDPDTPILGEKQTVVRVNNLLQELKEYVDRKNVNQDKEMINTPVGTESLKKEKEKLEAQLKNPSETWKGRWDGIKQQETARNRLDAINKELDGLNSKYVVGQTVKDIYIKDLVPDDKPMDLMTAIRVACYGNDQDIAWRVEAVLKLERYCEPLFIVKDNDVEFKGQIGDLFGLFKDSFRVDKEDADNWCLWFRDRFIPVMKTYVGKLKQYRRGNPGVVWKTLSVTARFEVAQALVNTRIKVNEKTILPVWMVRAAPFKNSVSPSKPEKVDRMLKLLGEASSEARLRDPEGEAGRTNVSAWAKEISPHKPGGGYSPNYANVETVDKAKTRKDIALGGQYGTSTARGAGTGNTHALGGVYMTPTSKYGYKPLNGDSDTSHLDMSGVKVLGQGGDDKGASVPRKTAEQLIIREMLKQGFTDPRAIAEMLALTNFESQGYTRTVENMKYSSPERLVRMFKEVKNMEQARQLVAAGEQAIANTVYGGAKGAQLGNNAPGDGWKYRGRGFVHLTGKANYAKIGQAIGVDLVNHPEKASQDPNVMAAIAVEFFKNSKLLQSITATNDFGKAATGLNGGNPLPDMEKRYNLYTSYLKQLESGQLAADENAVTAANTSMEMGNGQTPSMEGGATGGQTAGSMYSGGGMPMIGGGNTPTLGATPGGGSALGQYGGGPAAGGYSGVSSTGGGEGQSLVSNYSGGNSGLRLKSGESMAGGPSHPGVIRLAQLIQSRVAGFRFFTALNDAYHHSKPGNSKHKSGLAVDFVLTNGINGSDAAVRTVQEIMGGAGMTPRDYMIINEYRKLSANGTGGHVHVGFTSAEAADKFAKAAGASEAPGQDTTTGGTVEERAMDMATPAAPPGPTREGGSGLYEPVPERTGSSAPSGGEGPAFANTGMPTPPPVQAPPVQPAQQSNNNITPLPTPQSRMDIAPAPSEGLSELIDTLGEVMSKTGTQHAALLQGILDQLIALNKKEDPQAKSVNLG